MNSKARLVSHVVLGRDLGRNFVVNLLKEGADLFLGSQAT